MGATCLILDLLAWAASLPLLMLEITGWPWNASIRSEAAGQFRAELVHDNGKVETFAGTREQG